MNKICGVVALCLVVTVPGFGEKIICEGSSTVGPIAKAFAEHFMTMHPEVQVSVSESGSGNGAKALVGRSCDIATMSRPMKESELASAREQGIHPVQHVAALDGLAVVAHPSNPVAGLTLEQIRDIYLGKITNWKAVGGADQPMLVISRDTNSGTFEAFEALVMNKEKITDRAETVGSNGQMRSRVESTPAAIGYVGLGFLEGIKALEVNGVAPDAETVKDGSYPISRELYFYTNAEPPPSSPVGQFIRLPGTEAGRQIIEEIGFVPAR